MRKFLVLIVTWLVLCGGVVVAQQVLPGFPPGAFSNKAATDPAPGGGSWTPHSLSNLFAYYDASVGVTQVAGNVASWADQSGNGFDANVVSGSAPTYTTTSCNASHPGVNFSDGNGELLYTGTPTTLNSATLSLWSLFEGTGAGSTGQIFYTSGGTAYSLTLQATDFIYPFSGGTVLGNSGSAFTFTPDTPQWLGNILDGSNAHAYLNSGVEQGSPVSFSSAIGSGITNLQLTGSNSTTCYLIVTTGVMSAGDISSLKTWTNTNWGTSF